MDARQGFDIEMARAVYDSHQGSADPINETFDEFCQRTKDCRWFGLWSQSCEPAAAVFVEKGYTHTTVCPRFRGKCGFSITAIYRLILGADKRMLAPVLEDNAAACRGLTRLGFKILDRKPGWLLYGRFSS